VIFQYPVYLRDMLHHAPAAPLSAEWLDALRKVGRAFRIVGLPVAARPYGSGHINDTFAADFARNGDSARYIFQRINHHVFHQPERLMENIDRVTRHLAAKTRARGAAGGLELLRTADGAPIHRTPGGDFWRGFHFIPGARSHDIVDSTALAFEAARAFGAFQCDLADLPAPRLHDTIPHFHDTPRRFDALERAIAEDRADRAAAAQPEIDFVTRTPRNRRPAHRPSAAMVGCPSASRTTTPNSTTSSSPRTPAARSASSTSTRSCPDSCTTTSATWSAPARARPPRTSATSNRDRHAVRLISKRCCAGYPFTAGAFLTPEERRHLPFSGALITLEIGARFLTDHLAGDVYFKTHRVDHNLDRARAQFRLVESIEEQMERMTELLGRIETERAESPRGRVECRTP
jgi:hypothetical protein